MSETLTAPPTVAATTTEAAAPPERTVFQSCFYDLVRATTGLALTTGWGFRSTGRHNIPPEGPALLIANHQSFLDPILVGVSSGRRLGYLARKTLFGHRLFSWCLRTIQAVPIDQEGVGIEGLRIVLRLLKAGQAVLVFPEGNRSEDGFMQSLQPGVQLLIRKTLAPVVPIGIAGAYDAWPRWRKYPIPAPIVLPPRKETVATVIGKPLDARLLAELPKKQLLDTLHKEISQVVGQAERLRRGAAR